MQRTSNKSDQKHADLVPDLSKGHLKYDSSKSWDLDSNSTLLLSLFTSQISTSIDGNILSCNCLLFDTVTVVQRLFTRRH
jgi:hypothetical protein